MNKNAQAGFTLIEILIAVAIVALMGTVSLGLFRYLGGAKVKTAQTALKTFKSALLTFNIDAGQFPEQLKDLIKKPSDEAIARVWQGPYIEGATALIDPWNRKYQYKKSEGNAEHEYELYSYGEKGKSASKAEWISVWDL